MKLVKKDVDWSIPPEIRWEKVLCPVCGGPTGPSSRCFELETELLKDTEQDRSLIKTVEVNGEMLPVFSSQCVFRKNNDYYFYTNYPLSHPMVTIIGSVHGLEKLIIYSAYRGKITIADQFDEQKILLEIENRYRGFVNGIKNNEEE